MNAAVADSTLVSSDEPEGPSLFRLLLRRPLAVVCMAFLAGVVAAAIIAPWVLPSVASEHAGDLLQVRQGPSAQHLLGTDSLGRDVLDRLLVGARPTLLGVAEALVVAFGIGVPFGLAAGYLGGSVDRVAAWITDISFSVPSTAIVLVVLAVFAGNMLVAMMTFGVLAAPSLGRVVRSATLAVREELYVAAAHVSGLSRPYIIFRHVIPRIAGTIIVLASLWAGGAMVAQTGFAYLGLIVTQPAPSWGGMVNDGIQALNQQSWLIWPPGIMMTLTVLAFGLLGDAVRDSYAARWSATPGQVKQRRRVKRGRLHRASPPPAADEHHARADALLAVDGLTVSFPAATGRVNVVEGVSFEISPGETVGLLGESGCGKTMTAMAVLGLLGNGEVTAGRIVYKGRDLVGLAEADRRHLRGNEIGIVSQEPMPSLNPAFRIGFQLAIAIRAHHRVSRRAARTRALELLGQVQLPDPETVARKYPHEVSGGMAQRIAIARALAGEPKLLILDEPTTALDVTLQAEIFDLLREIQRERGTAMLVITHDWGVLADLCDRAIVMYAGQIVEQGRVRRIFHEPRHPYTAALLAANPHNVSEVGPLATIPGQVPRPGSWPVGCHFHPRCAFATPECHQPVAIEAIDFDHETRCIHHERLRASAHAAS